MLERDNTMLVVVDVQERLLPALDRNQDLLAAIVRLIAGCRELAIPMLVTEQYAKGLGPTVPEVAEAMGEWYRPIEKMSFSACGELHFMQQLEAVGRQDVILCGAESHVCVYQTAMDLRNLGYTVEVANDAISSRAEANHLLATAKMARHEVELTSVEMALFEMMVRADIPEFKAISKIVR